MQVHAVAVIVQGSSLHRTVARLSTEEALRHSGAKEPRRRTG